MRDSGAETCSDMKEELQWPMTLTGTEGIKLAVTRSRGYWTHGKAITAVHRSYLLLCQAPNNSAIRTP